MALTAAQICEIARERAKCPGFTRRSGQLLNSILSGLCQEYDLDAAGGTFNFNFTTAQAPIGNLNVQLASGPMPLPADYLRCDKDGAKWFNLNFPYQLVPCDITEFDALVQQAGVMSFPTIFATDMSQAAPVLTTTGDRHATTLLDNLASTAGLVPGLGVAGPGIVPGTQVVSVGSAGSLLTGGDDLLTGGSDLLTGGGSGVPNSVVLSQAATSSNTGDSYYFAVPAVAYVWPPASGSYPAMLRYRRLMPDIASPETSAQIPWFPQQEFLIQELAGRLCLSTGDDRWQAMLGDSDEATPGGSRVLLRRYLKMNDDNTNRAKRVTLDRRRFGPSYSTLPKSKILGW